VYFNGAFNKDCNAGVNYQKLVGSAEPGYARRLPCFTLNPKDQHVICVHYRLPTQEELAAFEADIQAHLDRMKKVFPMIAELKREYRGRDGAVEKACPVCGGMLYMTISAYNGHVHGSCSTPQCLSWVE